MSLLFLPKNARFKSHFNVPDADRQDRHRDDHLLVNPAAKTLKGFIKRRRRNEGEETEWLFNQRDVFKADVYLKPICRGRIKDQDYPARAELIVLWQAELKNLLLTGLDKA